MTYGTNVRRPSGPPEQPPCGVILVRHGGRGILTDFRARTALCGPS